MINGIMKLFYTEIVKSKINKLPNEEYKINNQLKKIQEISQKIDKALFYILKALILIVILIIASNINIYFGISAFIIEIAYLFYKKSLKIKVKEEIENIKNNVKINKKQILKEKDKKNIAFLISILLLGVITDFNMIIIISFCLIFIITIRDIYLNFKNKN